MATAARPRPVLPPAEEPAAVPALPADVRHYLEHVAAGRPGSYAHVALLGLRTFDAPGLLRATRRGLRVAALERLQRNLALSAGELESLVDIPARTLARRRADGRLTPEESDRLLRASRLLGRALEVFEGELAAARRWLGSPQPALGGAVPFAVGGSEIGAAEVVALLDRLEHGVFS